MKYEGIRDDLESLCQTIPLEVDEELYEEMRRNYREEYGFEEETLAVSGNITGRYDNLEEIRKAVVSLRTVGYSLAGMIFIIGALNIVNTSLSSAAVTVTFLTVAEGAQGDGGRSWCLPDKKRIAA